ncbi:MAG: 16S rRNA (guanine(966)-N(2))-methyltransferase RsmD [Gammaproteobacteria bacterium]
MSHVRITGGQACGQKIRVPDVKMVRPSPDRARTTLFNWLMPFTQGIRVLDLYAGSGILSYEALSRGASEAHLVDINKKVNTHLNHCAKTWTYGHIHIYLADCQKWLLHHAHLGPFDLIFLDPPFHQNTLLQRSLEHIQQQRYLAKNGFIYTERAQQAAPPTVSNFSVYREKRFGTVIGTLYIEKTV